MLKECFFMWVTLFYIFFICIFIYLCTSLFVARHKNKIYAQRLRQAGVKPDHIVKWGVREVIKHRS